MPGWGNRTPEQRAAAAQRARQLSRDPTVVAKRTAWMRDPARKGELVARGRRTADLCRSDIVVKAAWLAGVYRASGKPARRKRSSEVMMAIMASPAARERSRKLAAKLNRSKNSKKGWITRRRNKLAARMKTAAAPGNRREL
jgi:hypothetical protein